MLINIKPRVVKPPFGSVQIGRGHPLVRGLVASFLFNEGGSLTNLARAATPATLGLGDSWTQSVYGSAVNFDGVSSANDKIVCGTGYGSLFNSSAAVTVVAFVTIVDPTGNHGVVEQTGAADAVNNAWLVFTEANTWRARIDTTVAEYTTNGGAPLLGPIAIGLTWSQASGTLQMWGSGQKLGLSVATSGNFKDTTGNLLIGSLGSGAYPWKGTISLIHLWTRELSAGEMLWVWAEPYAFLQPVPAVRYWSSPAAAAVAAGSVVSPRSLSLLGVGS